ncbi:HD domain-containing protein [Radiobacillus kanasensis]|uniref:HD-GYP domain-containing protein n=1 Tax=Radiobacillus kanasensis TaxID=2844358 RepID=UPI001E631975|nr:HD domain-containing phosphohydrolase [Radiobacillus kanasensis]UFT99176.1 HD domain-containing protein [Radiobacillus kanasensis]
MDYRSFQRILIRNYILGSLIAVIVIGSTFIFQTINVDTDDRIWFALIIACSFPVMFISEYLVFSYHIKPIKRILPNQQASLEELERAYQRTQELPFLTVKRILIPHYFGLAIPASGLAGLFIYWDILNIPSYYIIFAFLGGGLIAITHAIIEFFFTSQAIKPVLKDLKQRAQILHSTNLSLQDKVLLTIRNKFIMSTLFIAIFPVLLFSLATQIRLLEIDANITAQYWSWAGVIIVIVFALAIFLAILLTKEIEQPLHEIQNGMKKVQSGNLDMLDGYYSDEFTNLISGFNHMSTSIKEKNMQNTQLLESFFTVFAATLDARDHYTAGHSIRVAGYTTMIGECAKLPEDELNLLRKSALLHDIGKIGVRDQVLQKDGRLTDEEFAEIKLHPVIGAQILEEVKPKEAMVELIPGVKHHHERYDGKGYPSGLAGENIPKFGRIMAVADAFDAMTTDRPYRKGMTVEKALSILEEGKGTQWDPYYAQLFIEHMTGKEKL